MYFIFSCLRSINIAKFYSYSRYMEKEHSDCTVSYILIFNLIYEKLIYCNSQLITSKILSTVLTSLRVHVHPLTSRLPVPRCQKITVFICRKAEVIQK